jgi:uncharacterized SAM-binding protein YcdF (DUF218 family)
MILRFLSLLLLVYLLGFIFFGVTLAGPAGDQHTDAAVVITGGPGRIEHAMDVLKKGQARRLLISGVDPSVTKKDLGARLGGMAPLLKCCVDLGTESVDTRSNAEEAKRWMDKHRFHSFRLITSDWHMRRANYEFRRVFGGSGDMIVVDAVPTQPKFTTLFAEYNKYLLRRISAIVE